MTKKNFSLTQKQREDLAAAYRKIYSKCRSQTEAWEKTVVQPAPRFYVTPKQCYEKMRLMVRGDFSEVDKMEPLRKQMYYDMFDILLEMTQQKEYLGHSLWFICQFLVNKPAPQFYLRPRTISQVFMLAKKYGAEYRHAEIYRKNKPKK